MACVWRSSPVNSNSSFPVFIFSVCVSTSNLTAIWPTIQRPTNRPSLQEWTWINSCFYSLNIVGITPKVSQHTRVPSGSVLGLGKEGLWPIGPATFCNGHWFCRLNNHRDIISQSFTTIVRQSKGFLDSWWPLPSGICIPLMALHLFCTCSWPVLYKVCFMRKRKHHCDVTVFSDVALS